MKIEDIITSLKYQASEKDNLAGGDPDSIFTHDATMLLEAAELLQGRPAKLDRSRWEGCRFCKGDLEGYTTEFKDVNGKQRRLFIPEGKAMIVAPGKYNYKLCIPIKYCPFCSCPLTEESWAEMERRINDES